MNTIQFAQRNAIIKAHETAIRTELARHPAVKATLALFPPKLRDKVRLSISDYSNSVQFSLTMDSLDSFKDKGLLKILERFAEGDWGSRSTDYTGSDTPNRDFHFNRAVTWAPKPSKHTRWLAVNCGEYYIPKEFEIYVGIYTYVKSDSPLCRMVVTEVKEEVVRKEIKQIVCA